MRQEGDTGKEGKGQQDGENGRGGRQEMRWGGGKMGKCGGGGRERHGEKRVAGDE